MQIKNTEIPFFTHHIGKNKNCVKTHSIGDTVWTQALSYTGGNINWFIPFVEKMGNI